MRKGKDSQKYGGTEWKNIYLRVFFFFYSFSIWIWFSFMYGEIWSKTERCFIWLVLEMTADSCGLRDFLQCMGLIKMTWEKIECVWALICGRNGRFDRHFLWLIVCVRSFFFLDCIGFRRFNVRCNLCMGWSICLRKRWFPCWSVLWFLWGFNGLWCRFVWLVFLTRLVCRTVICYVC